MSIEKVSIILQEADKKGYGVPAFNVFNYESISWAIRAAQLEKSPVIIQFYPGFSDHISIPAVAAIVKEIGNKAEIPVGLHLDHCFSYEQAIEGIQNGFPSVMIDGSNLDFTKNVALTKEVALKAHAVGFEVEAELGCVGSGSKVEDYSDKSKFTNPYKAKDFVVATEVDSLAISIGNAHGHYLSSPNLDIKRLKKIRSLTDIPLVLHGGSDIPKEQIQKAVMSGICKVNIATEYNQFIYKVIKKNICNESSRGYMYGVLKYATDEVIEFLRNKIQLLSLKN